MVGEIATQHLLVVLNKVDLLPAELRPRLVAKACKRLAQTFAATTFAACPMVAVSAKPGVLPDQQYVANTGKMDLIRLQNDFATCSKSLLDGLPDVRW